MVGTMIFSVLVGMVSCVDVEGGAVEIRWAINDANGIRISCADAGFSDVRLFLAPQNGPDAGLTACPTDPCTFPCTSTVGTTAFVIDAGTYEMWIRPIDINTGEALGETEGVTTPPTIVREVIRGELTELGVYLIAVDRP